MGCSHSTAKATSINQQCEIASPSCGRYSYAKREYSTQPKICLSARCQTALISGKRWPTSGNAKSLLGQRLPPIGPSRHFPKKKIKNFFLQALPLFLPFFHVFNAFSATVCRFLTPQQPSPALRFRCLTIVFRCFFFAPKEGFWEPD